MNNRAMEDKEDKYIFKSGNIGIGALILYIFVIILTSIGCYIYSVYLGIIVLLILLRIIAHFGYYVALYNDYMIITYPYIFWKDKTRNIPYSEIVKVQDIPVSHMATPFVILRLEDRGKVQFDYPNTEKPLKTLFSIFEEYDIPIYYGDGATEPGRK